MKEERIAGEGFYVFFKKFMEKEIKIVRGNLSRLVSVREIRLSVLTVTRLDTRRTAFTSKMPRRSQQEK